MIRASWTILALGALLPCTTLAQTHAEPIRVNLIVSGYDTAFKARVESYLARELRDLGDVMVVDTLMVYKVDVVAMNIGYDGNFALSLVVIRCWKGLEFYRLHYAFSGIRELLKEQCQNLIATVDSEVLQEHRLAMQLGLSD